MTVSWATNEMEDWLINDEGMYKTMNRIINRAKTVQEAADELRESFSWFESCGSPIGKQANFVAIVKSQTKPEDWVEDIWKGIAPDDEDDDTDEADDD